jgi:O-antigen/teichoic acid export membrane protein
VSSIDPARQTRAMLPVLVAAGASGTAGYVVLVLAARVLAPADNADFLVFWGAVFAVFGALVGVATETTRAVYSAADKGSTLVLPVALGLGGTIALVVGVTGLLWAPRLFGARWPGLLAAMVVGIALFAFHAALVGSAAGRAAWNPYSLLVGSEAVSRLILCTAVAVAGGLVLGLAWAVSLAAGTWIVWLLSSRQNRRLAGARADVGRGALLRRMGAACLASGVSALLLVGYPVLLRITSTDPVYAGAAPIVLAVSLSRAPLMVPLGVYQNVLVTKVIRKGVRVMVPVVAVLGGATLSGSLLAWLVGPWLLRLVNPAYHVSGPVFAALVLGAGLLALLTVTGAATVALDHHDVYLVGWITATAVSVGALLVPWSLEARVVSSLVVGPLAGVAVHLQWGMRRRRAASRLPTPSP